MQAGNAKVTLKETPEQLIKNLLMKIEAMELSVIIMCFFVDEYCVLSFKERCEASIGRRGKPQCPTDATNLVVRELEDRSKLLLMLKDTEETG